MSFDDYQYEKINEFIFDIKLQVEKMKNPDESDS